MQTSNNPGEILLRGSIRISSIEAVSQIQSFLPVHDFRHLQTGIQSLEKP